jgi:hypothetical protein
MSVEPGDDVANGFRFVTIVKRLVCIKGFYTGRAFWDVQVECLVAVFLANDR